MKMWVYLNQEKMKSWVITAFLSVSGPLFASSKNKELETNNSTSFVFLGDTGTGKEDQYTVARGLEKYCAQTSCQFALLLGDNFYPDGVTSTKDPKWKTHFEKPYERLSFPFYAVLGNHDYHLKPEAQIQYQEFSQKWKMPGRNYRFEINNVAFYGIDTETFNTQSIAWLEENLSKETKDWTIVFAHHPIYSYGSHGSDDDLQKRLLPLLLKYNVPFYLSGHDHDQQVLFQKNRHFIVMGSGGAGPRYVGRGRDTLFARSGLGFGSISIRDKELTLKVLDEKGDLLFEKKVEKVSPSNPVHKP